MSAGTEPGTFCSARKPMMPIIARRPLLISLRRPASFFSADAFFEKPKGSYRSKGTGWGITPLSEGKAPGLPPFM